MLRILCVEPVNLRRLVNSKRLFLCLNIYDEPLIGEQPSKPERIDNLVRRSPLPSQFSHRLAHATAIHLQMTTAKHDELSVRISFACDDNAS